MTMTTIPVTVRNKAADQSATTPVTTVVTHMVQFMESEEVAVDQNGHPLQEVYLSDPGRATDGARVQVCVEGQRYESGFARWAQVYYPVEFVGDVGGDTTGARTVELVAGTPTSVTPFTITHTVSVALQTAYITLQVNGQTLDVNLRDFVGVPRYRIIGTDHVNDVARTYARTYRMSHLEATHPELKAIWIYVAVELRSGQNEAQVWYQVGDSHMSAGFAASRSEPEYAASLTLTTDPTITVAGCSSRFRYEDKDFLSVSRGSQTATYTLCDYKQAADPVLLSAINASGKTFTVSPLPTDIPAGRTITVIDANAPYNLVHSENAGYYTTAAPALRGATTLTVSETPAFDESGRQVWTYVGTSNQYKMSQMTAPFSGRGILFFGGENSALIDWDPRGIPEDFYLKDFPATGHGSIQEFPSYITSRANAITRLIALETTWDALGTSNTPYYHVGIGHNPRTGDQGNQGIAFGPQRFTILLRAGYPALIDAVERYNRMWTRHFVARVMDDSPAGGNRLWNYREYNPIGNQGQGVWLGNFHPNITTNRQGINIPPEGSVTSSAGAAYEGPNRQHGTLTVDILARFVSGDVIARRNWEFLAQTYIGACDMTFEGGYSIHDFEAPRMARYAFHGGTLLFEGVEAQETRDQILDTMKRMVEMFEVPPSQISPPTALERRYWSSPTAGNVDPFPNGIAISAFQSIPASITSNEGRGNALPEEDAMDAWQEAIFCYGLDMAAHLFDWVGDVTVSVPGVGPQLLALSSRWSPVAKRIAGEIAGTIARYGWSEFGAYHPVRNPNRWQFVRIGSPAGGTFTDEAARTALVGQTITQAASGSFPGASGRIVLVTSDAFDTVHKPIRAPLDTTGTWVWIADCTNIFDASNTSTSDVTMPGGRTGRVNYNFIGIVGNKAIALRRGRPLTMADFEETHITSYYGNHDVITPYWSPRNVIFYNGFRIWQIPALRIALERVAKTDIYGPHAAEIELYAQTWLDVLIAQERQDPGSNGISDEIESYTTVVEAFPDVGVERPADPSDFSGVADSPTTVGLNWRDNSTTETAFQIQMATGGQEFALVASPTANAQYASITDLTEDTPYLFRIRAYDATNNLASAWVGPIEVTTPEEGGGSAPAVPTDLAGTGVTKNRIDLTWTQSTGSPDGYVIKVELDTALVRYQYVSGGTAEAATILDLEPDTEYEFYILAYNASGQSEFSTPVSVATLDDFFLEKPTDLAVVSTEPTTAVATWTNAAIDATGFLVQVKLNSAGDWTGALEFEVEAPDVQAGDQVSTDLSGLTADTAYNARVRATNLDGTSDWSTTANFSTIDPGVGDPPDPVTDLTAVSNEPTSLTVGWTEPASADGYRISISADQGVTWRSVDTIAYGNGEYTIDFLTPATSYRVRIVAYDDNGESDPAEISGTTQDPPSPAAPSDPTATGGDRQIVFGWTDNSDNELGFEIEITSPTSIMSVIVDPDTEEYTEDGLGYAVTHTYRVRAFNAEGNSAWSAAVSATTDDEPPPPGLTEPAAPTSLELDAVGARNARISWKDNSDNESGFEVERYFGLTLLEPDGDTSGYQPHWGLIATVSANQSHYEVTGLLPETTYTFRVRAVNAAGQSDYTEELEVTTEAIGTGHGGGVGHGANNALLYLFELDDLFLDLRA